MDGHDSASGPPLGELVEEYGPSSRQQLFYIAWGLALVCAGAFLIWIAISTGNPLALVGGVLGVVAIAVGAFVFWQAFALADLRIRLFERGFTCERGKQAITFRWEEIDGVDLTETDHRDRHGNTLYYTHTFRVRAPGREFVLNDTEVRDGETLGRAIMREARHCHLKARLSRALSLEAAGEWAAALAAFEHLLAESPYNEIANQSRDHIQRLRQHGSGPQPGSSVEQSAAGSREAASHAPSPQQLLREFSRKAITTDALLRGLVGYSDWLVPVIALAGREGPNAFAEVVIFNDGTTRLPARELWAFTDRQAAERAVAAGSQLGGCVRGVAGMNLFRNLGDHWDLVRINPGSPEAEGLFLSRGGFEHAAAWVDALNLEQAIAAELSANASIGEAAGRTDRLRGLMSAYQDFLVLENRTTGQLVTLLNSMEGFSNPLVLFTAPDCRDAFLARLPEAQRSVMQSRAANGAGLFQLSPDGGMDGVIINPFGPGPRVVLPLGSTSSPNEPRTIPARGV